MNAIEMIRQDLRELGRRRRRALLVYLGILAALLGFFFLLPAKPGALPRDGAWTVAFSLLVLAVVLAASVTIGYPLVSRPAVYTLTLIIGVAAIVALWLTMDPAASSHDHAVQAGMPCFAFGTAIGAVAMLGLGALSGSLWRRFPNPGVPLALGMTGVGLAALHMRCGGADPVHLFGFHLTPLFVIYLLAHFAVRTKDALLSSSHSARRGGHRGRRVPGR